MHLRAPFLTPRLERRAFVRASAALAAGAVAVRPAGGLFAAGSERIRIGVVGCGGRGTGAALQAAADPAVEITCLGDLFADQLASSARLLAARAGRGFACPPERQFVGPDAWRRVVESPVDIVILATPPAFRPLHVAAAVRAGKHVYCERPAAVDAAGVLAVLAACGEAGHRGLSFAAGLAHRHDAATREAVSRIHDGVIGRPRRATAHARVGLPWRVPRRSEWTPDEHRLRNWISCAAWSGGHLVERHVAAIDRALWALGDEDPVAVVPIGGPVPSSRTATRVHLVFADGRSIDAAIDRGPHGRTLVVETVGGSAGTVDLRAAAEGTADPNATAMRDLLEAVRMGRPIATGEPLCRSTLAAVLGRQAAETGLVVTWTDGFREVARPAGPLQSAGS
jgi:myo-inositol 2-dehydrogenase/D-chiro-inositol 1-dehydrogenase